MKKSMHVLFDFDGTMVNSFDVVIRTFNLLSAEFAFNYISDQGINDLKKFYSTGVNNLS